MRSTHVCIPKLATPVGQARKCSGALVWQPNDCWRVTSGATIDYLLRKKPAYYAMSRVLRPTAVGVRRKYRDCSVCHARPAKVLPWELWVVSSKMTEVVADVELRFISISTGNDIKKKITKRITITSTAQLMLRMVLLTTCQKSHMFLLLGFGLTGYACLVIWSRSRSSTSRLRIEGLKFLNMGMSC
jgi:hypothetical protein